MFAMSMKFNLQHILLCVAAVTAELDPNDVNKQLKDLGYEGPTPPSVEQGQKAFEEQCRKHGGEEAVEKGKVKHFKIKKKLQS
jgi:hypothetical protein